MEYFTDCQSVEEAKKRYRELLMQYHPGHAEEEGEAITKQIIRQFNTFLNSFMSHSFNSYYADKEYKASRYEGTCNHEVSGSIPGGGWAVKSLYNKT